ncbi:MAG TPA: carboxypeptidase regulatory-like domain-containing protein [Pseudobacteroides sp.]|nr:carboxypeptidase regulatory-like domain-containing protein [Pseudobacteroides sp.]
MAPDVSNGEAKGFSVKVKNSQQYHSQTDDKGYFEILGLPNGNYTLEITKAGYLTREISVLTQNSDTIVAAQGSPILIWAGDIPVNDVQDGAINMKDVIEIGKCFNATKIDARYNKFCDLNMDGNINMSDIVIIARHFGKTTADYN